MKNIKLKELTLFQKVMIVCVPVIVLLLIASVVMFLAMMLTHNFNGFGFFSPGNIVIVMASCSSVLAIAGIIFSIFSAGSDSDDE